ncbi:hypothetical protein CAPTEDRAFT_214131 [Capitella teleta]|uniref:Uncharacterized protein n=1 Tax=Capitella teleta TaxID=283909 RepID=R7TT00_CAPTE|nr:hypothetical protein CAPTEDRAFT_214131 [Capitella teleta]|eukprot:ELT94155.1 hypothetical protein CAPTEDRAFT_214131 [Capitella teleta]
MKGVLVFSAVNDLSFMSVDDEFKRFIVQKATESGMVQSADTDEDELDLNTVTQLLSPLIASQRFMLEEAGNAYQVIRCEDGLCFVFDQFRDFIYLAVNGDGTENENFLHRKLTIVHRVLTFFYGPVIEEIHPTRAFDRQQRWKLIDGIIQTWSELYATEQSFLVEAVERLYVNQRLNAECIELLESALRSLQSVGEKTPAHGLLLVNCKLLALFSSKNACELTMSDTLLLTLLVNSLYSGGHTPVLPASPPAVKKTSVVSASSINNSMQTLRIGAIKQSSLDAQTDAPKTPSPVTPPDEVLPKSSPGSSSSSCSPAPNAASSPYPLVMDEKSSPPQSSFMKVLMDAAQAARDSSPPLSAASSKNEEDDESLQSVDWVNISIASKKSVEKEIMMDDCPYVRNSGDEVKVFTVLLRNNRSKFAPHLVHCIPIMPGTVLVTLSEFYIQKHPSKESNTQLLTNLETSVKRLSELTKAYKGIESINNLIMDIMSNWNQLRQTDAVVEFVSTSKIPSRLVPILRRMTMKTKELFRILFLGPREMSTAISTDFPGLVHFIYIDRNADQMTAPSINIGAEGDDEENDMGRTLKKKLKAFVRAEHVWKSVEKAQMKLKDGYTAMTARDGEYFVSYFLWFEDPMGNQLAVKEPFKGYSSTIPGILSGNFYKRLVHDCFRGSSSLARPIHCYELLCVHVGLVPSQHVFNHCQRLAAMLWETSEGARTPYNLL